VGTRQSERRLGIHPIAEPTRRTLVFPAVELPRARRIATPPPLPAYPPSRPSERPTLKTLPPVDDDRDARDARIGTGNAEVIELSASALDSDPSLIDLDLGVGVGRGRERERERERERARRAGVGMSLPGFEPAGGWRARARVVRAWLRYAMIGACLAGVMVAVNAAADVEPFGTASLTERVTGVSDRLHWNARAPNEPAVEHTALVLRAPGAGQIVPAGACATSGSSKVLAKHAHLAPGLDVNVVDGSFGVGFAASRDEAVGMRVDGSPLRVGDRVRVRTASAVRHVAVEGGRGDDDDTVDVRVDGDDSRTVVPDGETPAFRVTTAGGWIQIVGAGLSTGKTLWPVPGAGARASARASASAGAGARASAGASAGAGAGAGAAARAADAKAKGDAIVEAMTAARARAGATRTHDGFVRIGSAAAPSGAPFGLRRFVAAPEPVDLRVAARSEGGAVVALRRPSALWLGLVSGRFAAEGPLVALTRPGAAVGMPAVAPYESGGAVAWAERAGGEHEWLVMVASFTTPDDGSSPHEAPAIHVIATGMSPSLAELPDGDLLLAYAVGSAGAHRVVVQRLGHGLEPRGDALVVSPEELNAGQPAAAAAPDGRALVAFFGAERGRPSSVLVTPLACATGM
jgi:hypothetical protein